MATVEQLEHLETAVQSYVTENDLSPSEAQALEEKVEASASRLGVQRDFIVRDGELVEVKEHTRLIALQESRGVEDSAMAEMNRFHRIWHCNKAGDTSVSPVDYVNEHRTEEWEYEAAAYTDANVPVVDAFDDEGNAIKVQRFPEAEWHVERIQDWDARKSEE
jgi:hypothetical protein